MNETDVYGAVIDELRGFDFGAVDRIVLSASKGGVRKIIIRPIILKSRETWQFEKFIGSQVFHENVAGGDMQAVLLVLLAENGFREINIMTKIKTVHYRASKKGRLFRDECPRGHGAATGSAVIETAADNLAAADIATVDMATSNMAATDIAAVDMAATDIATVDMAADGIRVSHADNNNSRNFSRNTIGHDRKKSYILTEGMSVMPLVDLGIFDADMRVKKSKYDKYRQINRFLEIIADSFKNGAADSSAYGSADVFTIIDFGCGKSYLTFLIYYYFSFILRKHVRIFGYDVKCEVVARCNEIAAKYGYGGIVFEYADISRQMPADIHADMMVTLHACDTATDYALYYAIKNKVHHIFSVPCCQHELNAKIKRSDEFSLLLRHGLYKERFSAILTDCVRCEILKDMGYGVDVVEFVSPENTLKNAMIRATLSPAAISPTALSPVSVAESAAQDAVSAESAARAAVAPYSNVKIAKLLSDFNVAHKLVELMSTSHYVDNRFM